MVDGGDENQKSSDGGDRFGQRLQERQGHKPLSLQQRITLRQMINSVNNQAVNKTNKSEVSTTSGK